MRHILRRSRVLASLAAAAQILVFAGGDVASGQPVSVVDQRGVRLDFPTPPERIVTIPIPWASIVSGLDRSPRRIVGMNPVSLTAIRGEWLGAVFPALAQARTDIVRGGQFLPNIETLLALRPDVVFQWADQGPDLTAPIERAGLRVFGQRYGTQAFLEETIERVGAMLGATDRANTLLARHRDIRAKITAAMAGLTEAQRPRAIYFGRFVQSVRPHGIGSYQVESFELAGARNAVTGVRGTSTDVTFEQVLTWAPEVIFLGAFDDAVPDDLYRDPKWASIPAVRDRRVYKFPTGGYRWDPPGLESPLAWIWLATLLHPDRVSIDLHAEMATLFELIHGRAPTRDEARSILRVTANAGSRGADRVEPR